LLTPLMIITFADVYITLQFDFSALFHARRHRRDEVPA